MVEREIVALVFLVLYALGGKIRLILRVIPVMFRVSPDMVA